jgi:hypothetical protein
MTSAERKSMDVDQVLAIVGIADMVPQIMESFDRLISMSRDEQDVSILNTNLARFRVWVGVFGANRSSADECIEKGPDDTPELRQRIVSLIQGLTRSIEEGKPKCDQMRTSVLQNFDLS